MNPPSTSEDTSTEPAWSLRWNTLDIAEADVERQLEEWSREDHGGEEFDERKAFDIACADSDLVDFAWEDITMCLTEKMKELAEQAGTSGSFWWVEVGGFGWRKLDGYKRVTAEDGRALLAEVLPKTDCTFTITPTTSCTDHYDADDNVTCFHVANAHHDAPTGGEGYWIWPARLCNDCDEITPAHGLKDGMCVECRKDVTEPRQEG